MLVTDVRKIAKEYGIKTSRIKKADMIKMIQKEEGNFDCFASATDNYCDQLTCLWREDCLESSSKKSS
ncbi:MAG: Rho termination factor N-terminal domain-containing protein [Gammaproteobacteria bacterium]|nr:Rho termination factor N-terminal domain-containing protein [Gammaproteobacteria bacterium]